MSEIKLIPFCDTYTENCVRLALKAEAVVQASNRELLGSDIHDIAMKYWERDTTEAVKKQLAEQNAVVAVADSSVVGFAAYKCNGHIGMITNSAVAPDCADESLAVHMYTYAMDAMRRNGVTHVMANCGADSVHDSARKAFEAVGFEKYLPHVRYYQILGEPPVLPETKLQIVPAREEHIADCVRIALRVWAGIHDAYASLQGEDLHEAFSSGWKEGKAAEIAAQQSSPTSFVALLDGKVVGFCGYRIENGILGVIGYNGVDPEYRGNGIARYMYEYAFDQMRKQGVTHARVFTGGDDGHGPARRAYEKAGFNKRLLSVTYYRTL